MRVLALLLAVLCLVVLPACSCGGPSAEPRMIVKSPIWFDSQPVLQPAGYAMAQPAATVMQAVPTYAAPAAACPTAGYTYAAPPVPQAPAASCR